VGGIQSVASVPLRLMTALTRPAQPAGRLVFTARRAASAALRESGAAAADLGASAAMATDIGPSRARRRV
jgi:hypothetical protein